MRSLAIGLLLILIISACKNPMANTQPDINAGTDPQTVVLVHGYSKDSRDMGTLAGFLQDAGYRTVSVDLPLTFDHVDDAAEIFAGELESVLADVPEGQSIALVGHSTGGLVIRYFLSHFPHGGRVSHAVLIATPNRGSTLAGIAGDLSDLLVETFATLESLRPENISKLGLEDPDDIKIGAIAGNKGNLVLGQLLKKENDGRVEVHSVYYPELDDFSILSYNHHEIHHQPETAGLVIRFIKTGSFEK